jgi:hypothetical protein
VKRTELRSGSIFFVASLLAGVLNYLFQVVAARQLPAADFAALNGWFSNLSIFFFAGGLLQYAGNFWPPRKNHLRLAIVGLNLFAAACLAYWLFSPGVLTVDRAIVVLGISTFFGWLQGQAQIRMAFGVLSAVNFFMALAKLTLTAAPIAEPSALDRYALALFASFLPGLWIASVFLWSAKDAGRPATKPAWSAPLVLSLATAIIPQFDMVLMSHTQSAESFSAFVHASLFSRAIYFLIFILAQWMLPRQILNPKTNFLSRFPLVLLVAGCCSLGLTLVSTWISLHMMNWPEAPGRILVALSCMHMSLLTLVYLLIQEAAAKSRIPLAAAVLIVLGLEFALQFALQLPSPIYLALAILSQTILLIAAWRRQR